MSPGEGCKIGLHSFELVKSHGDVEEWRCSFCPATDRRPYCPPVRPPYDPYREF